jgi:hypothetical protein
MHQYLLFFSLALVGFNSYTQTSFEKGYFINNSDIKVDCLIRNKERLDGTDNLEYKLSVDGNIQKVKLSDIKIIELHNFWKYEWKRVNVDISDNYLSKISRNRNPTFKEQKLLLKILVEGDANLYEYLNGSSKRFFYSLGFSVPVQLIYKNYISSNNKIGENKMYLQQLNNNLLCDNLDISSLKDLDYKRSTLTSFFIMYNKCVNSDYTSFYRREKKGEINVSIRPGLNSSSLLLDHKPSSTLDAKFNNRLAFRLGVEFEFILPLNDNKWGVILEPNFQGYNSESELAIQNVRVDYNSIELSLGIRRYFLLHKDSKIFVNGSLVIDFPSKSIIEFDNGLNYDINSVPNFAIGLGYTFNTRFALELRYYTSRDVVNESGSWFSDYNTVSIIFGYSFF